MPKRRKGRFIMNSIISSNLVSSASNVASNASIITSAVSASVSSASKLQKAAIGCGIVGAIAVAGVIGFKIVKSVKAKKADTQAEHYEAIKLEAEGQALHDMLDAESKQFAEEAWADVVAEAEVIEETTEEDSEEVSAVETESAPVVGKYGVLVENEDAFCKLADAMEAADLILSTDADKYAAARRQLDTFRMARARTTKILTDAGLVKYTPAESEAEDIRVSLISIETFLTTDKRVDLSQDAGKVINDVIDQVSEATTKIDAELAGDNSGIIDIEAATTGLKARQDAIASELESEFEEELAAEGLTPDGSELPEVAPEAKDEPKAATEEAEPEEPQYVKPRYASTPWTTIGSRENVMLLDAIKTHIRKKISIPEIEVHDYPELPGEDENAKKARETKAATETVQATVRMLTELRINLFTGEEVLDDNNRKFINTCMNRIYRASGYDPTALIAKVLNLSLEIPDWCDETGCNYYSEFEEVVSAWEPKFKNGIDVKVRTQLKPVVVESAFRRDRMLIRGIINSVIDVQIAKLHLGTKKA